MKITDYNGSDTVLGPQDYADAVLSQSACNLSGITHSFSRLLSKIWDEARLRKQGTDWVNQHPLCLMFLTQMAHLNGHLLGDGVITYSEASDYCEARSTQPTQIAA
jgi:hypothetical protein